MQLIANLYYPLIPPLDANTDFLREKDPDLQSQEISVQLRKKTLMFYVVSLTHYKLPLSESLGMLNSLLHVFIGIHH